MDIFYLPTILWNLGDPNKFNFLTRKLFSDTLFELWNWNYKIRE